MRDFSEIIYHLESLVKDKRYSCGWMSDYTLSLICSFIKYYRPDLIIHTGVLWGKSTAYILETLDNMQYEMPEEFEKSNDQDYLNFILRNRRKIQATKLITIDPDVFSLDINTSMNYLKSEYKEIDFEYYNMTSKNFFDTKLYPKDYNFLLGIVDGDHTRDGCWNDLKDLYQLDAQIIIVDDISWLSYLNDTCKEFADSYGYNYTKFKFDSGIGLLTK